MAITARLIILLGDVMQVGDGFFFHAYLLFIYSIFSSSLDFYHSIKCVITKNDAYWLLFVWSYSLVSSAKNNVGRGLNIALVNGEYFILLYWYVFACVAYALLTVQFPFSSGVNGDVLEIKAFDMWAGGKLTFKVAVFSLRWFVRSLKECFLSLPQMFQSCWSFFVLSMKER